MDIFHGLPGNALSVAEATLPLAGIFIAFQLLLLRLPRKQVLNILTGTLLASLGLLLFLQGVSIGFLPFGKILGETLGALHQTWLLVPSGFVLGFLTTWGEPSVRILADQVEEASNGSIRQPAVMFAICLGVAVFVGIGMLRIGYDIPLLSILVPGYAFVLVIMWFSDRDFLSIAVDAGGVATGPLANSFLLSLALGISSSSGEQDPVSQGLGMVALIALAPIISVIALGFVFNIRKR